MGLLAIFFPGRADDVARLFADKTGLWVATAIRAVLALGLFAAAGESKAPILLRILGGLILILAEAEEVLTSAKLASTGLANDFVQGCLQPARSPYEAQCLPEADAIRERKRCEAVRNRLVELRDDAA